MLTTRIATPADAEAITRIYNQGIEERIATFETEPRTTQQVTEMLREKGDHHPAVVVEQDGAVIAFAWASNYRSRPCYAGVAEHSVYVDREARGLGAGFSALNALSVAFAERGYWKLLSRIFPENVASLKLHERAGFRVVGTYLRHAKLDGEWRDTVIVEKLLGEAGEQ
jgi:phosphinothricin acetyltransferase